jgi:ABC-type glycerol-3-phosphate transport system permease component
VRRLTSTFLGYAILIFFGLIFLYPFFIQLATAFKTQPDAAANSLSLVPRPFDTTPPAGCSSTRWPATPWPGCASAAGPASSPPYWR